MKIKVFTNPIQQEDEINEFISNVTLIGEGHQFLENGAIAFTFRDATTIGMDIRGQVAKLSNELVKAQQTYADIYQNILETETKLSVWPEDGSAEKKGAIEDALRTLKTRYEDTKLSILNILAFIKQIQNGEWKFPEIELS